MPASTPDVTGAIRRFNRFYTARIGALGGQHLGTPYSLTEARVLYELGDHGPATAAALAQALEADPAQVSRTVARLTRAKLVSRERHAQDGRALTLSLSAAGRREFQRLDQLSRERNGAIVSRLSADERTRLLAAMDTIETLLSGRAAAPPAVVIRPHRPGDFGWIVSMHGAVYAEEYGWDISFEALVAGVAKEFIEKFDAKHEACWIAEVDGKRVGSVCLVRKSATVGKLRLLIVDPSARGLKVGTRLVDECLRFARRVGYRKVTLWTNSILDAARHIYEQAGFVKVETGPVEHVFGQDLVFETWELSLGSPR